MALRDTSAPSAPTHTEAQAQLDRAARRIKAAIAAYKHVRPDNLRTYVQKLLEEAVRTYILSHARPLTALVRPLPSPYGISTEMHLRLRGSLSTFSRHTRMSAVILSKSSSPILERRHCRSGGRWARMMSQTATLGRINGG